MKSNKDNQDSKLETWRTLVIEIGAEFDKKFLHSLNKDMIDYILWEHTAFPFAALSLVEEQIRRYFKIYHKSM